MIIKADTSHARALGELHVQAWRDAYEGMLPDSYLASLDPRSRAEGWQRGLGAGADVLLHMDPRSNSSELAGFAAFGRCRDEDAHSDWGELSAIYYLKCYWGSGMAAELLPKVRDGLIHDGYRWATLWVLNENARAIAFYQKHGFDFDGAERVDEFDGVEVGESRMITPLL